MDTIILCGGRGMRAWPLTEECPKPLLKVGGVELVLHVMRHYQRHGRNRFVLCLGYEAQAFIDAFPHSRCADLGLDVSFSDVGPGAGTATRLVHAVRMCEGDVFHVTYGDGLSDVDITKLEAVAQQQKRAVVLTAVQPRSRFGELMLDGDRVRMFVEKPVMRSWIHGGFMVVTRDGVARAQEWADRDVGAMFVKEPMQELAALGRVGVYKHRGFWACVDTSKDLQLLQESWDRGERLWCA